MFLVDRNLMFHGMCPQCRIASCDVAAIYEWVPMFQSSF